MWSAIGRVYAYWVSVSTFIFTTPYDRASRISSSATAEPAHMCEPNSGSCPLATRSAEILTSGRTNPSSLSFGQWSVCSATCTGYLSATTWANSASATAPVTMFLTYWPDRNSAPPVDTWTMPSLPASANPRTAAFSVSDDVTLIAGYAKPPASAQSEETGCRADKPGAAPTSRVPRRQGTLLSAERGQPSAVAGPPAG